MVRVHRPCAGPAVGALDCGGAHSVCICQDNAVYSFGNNWYGQLGVDKGSGGAQQRGGAGDRVLTSRADKRWWTYGKGLAWGAAEKPSKRDRRRNLAIPWEVRGAVSVCQVRA